MPASGQELDVVCRHLEVAESTWHRWLAQYGGMKVSDAKRLKELEAENARLKNWSPTRLSISTCSRRYRRETSNPEPQAQRRDDAARSVSGSPNGGLATWSACTAPRCAWHRRRLPPGKPACEPGCGSSAPTVSFGAGGGQPRWPAGRAGRSTTNASADSGARRACGFRSGAARSG